MASQQIVPQSPPIINGAHSQDKSRRTNKMEEEEWADDIIVRFRWPGGSIRKLFVKVQSWSMIRS